MYLFSNHEVNNEQQKEKSYTANFIFGNIAALGKSPLVGA